MSDRPSETQADLSTSLRATRLGVWLAMAAERLWPLVLPLLALAGVFLILAWFGVFRIVADQTRIGLLVMLAIAALGALALLRRFRLPGGAEVETRIEAANRLQHAPLRTQTEELGGKGDHFADALWREHRRRMAAKLAGLGGDLPRPNIPAYDKWALRSLVPLIAIIAFAYSYGPGGGRIADAVMPPAIHAAESPRIDAWITPPAYTGKAPIFLTAQANRETRAFTVPTGSELSLRITGGNGEESVSQFVGGAERAIDPREPTAKADPNVAAKKPASLQFALKIADDGDVALMQSGAELERWSFAVTPDRTPAIRFAGDPRQSMTGILELRYEIDDDYGAAKGAANITLVEPPPAGARPLYETPDVKLALPRRGANPPAAKVNPDLTKHIWAGVPVGVTLTATDAAGQEAVSEAKKFVLPEKPFRNPLARAVIELRRIVGLDANDKEKAQDLLDAITLRPEDTIQNPTHYIALMSLRTRMDLARSDDELRGVLDYMWEIALGIEDGSLSTAEQRLRAAQQALKEALERGASDEEISRLMQELRQAMNEFLREFAERAQRNQNAQQQPFDGQMLTQRDLQKMLDDIENQARSGNRDQAQALLDQLQNLMENLQAGRSGQQQQSQQGQGQMQQQMNRLGEIMRRQQEMMNETHRLDQQRRNGQQQQGQEGQQGQQGQRGQQNPNGGMSQEEFDEAMRQLREGQGKLQQDLNDLQEALKGMGIQPGEGFPQAGEQMGEAESALGQNQGEQATGHQGQALEALRRGAQDMMRQMQAMQGEEGEGQEGTRSQRNANRDPLNREMRNFGADDGDSTKVPDEIDAQRARQILEAIRKRLGNSLSPELERQYLERLLDLQ